MKTFPQFFQLRRLFGSHDLFKDQEQFTYFTEITSDMIKIIKLESGQSIELPLILWEALNG